MDEHHWKFKVGSGAYDQYRATTVMGAPCVQVLDGSTWLHWSGEPVAGEILRLAALSAELERKLEFHMREAAEAKARYHNLKADRSKEMLQLATALEEEENSSASLRLALEEAEGRIADLEALVESAKDFSTGE